MAKEPSEHALAVVKSGLNLIPILGGAIASLVDDYVPTATQRNIERALKLLGERLGKIEGRVDAGLMDKDEFAELFKSCALVIVRTHHEEKLQAVAGLLANMLLVPGDKEKLSYTEIDHYVRCVEFLSIGAIEVLGRAYELTENAAGSSVLTKPVPFEFVKLHRTMGSMDPHLLMGLIGELSSQNLVFMKGVPSIRTADYGNVPLEMTPLGAKFVVYLLRPQD